MKLKLHSKVFYPSHGAGWVKSKKEIEFNGQIKQYLEFEFINNPLTISTPIDKIDTLGIREVLSESMIKEAINILKKKPKIDPKTKDFNELINKLNTLEYSGDIHSFVEIIQYCNYIKTTRDNEGRLIPVSIEKQLSSAIENIAGELAVSKGIDIEKAKDIFYKTTNLKKT